jgi:translocation and assembly module TamB
VALHPGLAGRALAGQLQADVRLHGRWPRLQGDGEIDARGLRAGPLQLARGRISGRAGSEAQSALGLQIDVTDARWQDRHVPIFAAALEGSLADHRLRVETALPVVPPEGLSRSLALDTQRGTRLVAEAGGGLQHDGDGHRWAGALERLNAGAWDGRLPLSRPAPQDWLALGRVGVELAVGADGVLQHLRVDAGRLRLAGDVALSWQALDVVAGALRLKATVEDVAVAPVLARWQPTVGWEGNLRVGASIEIDLAETTRLDIVVERKGGDLGVREAFDRSVPLGLSDLRLALRAEDGIWTFSQALAGRTLGELGGAQQVRSRPQARWPAADDPMDGALVARVANLGVWGAWVPPGWRLQGSVQTQVRLGGRVGAPELTGELRGEGLDVRNLLQGVHVRDGEVLLRLSGERAVIERFVLKGGDGTLSLSGGAMLGAEPRAQLQVVAERFQLLSRIDRRLIASGQATLGLAPRQLSLAGAFGVDEALIDVSRSEAPSLDDDVSVRRAGEPPARDAAVATADRQSHVDVKVDLALGQRLRLRGYGLDTRLTGALRITAPGGRPAVNGVVSTADGTYAAYAQKLTIRRGDIAFGGPVDNPRLDVLALRPNLDVDVGVAITGTAQTPRVRLYARPDMPDTDKLSWLVLGRDPGELGRADTALVQRAAMALLAGDGESPADTLIGSIGLDEFSVRQDDAGTGDTIVSLGKQLSRRWYVGYERGVNATTGTWQLVYRLAQRFTLRAQSGAENSLDAIWVWRVP